ncbi:MAG: tetratricopeptide repeat protein [Bacteroidales bacterium]|nr:tetratricopeptide repeat protein [Candidatus Colicola faecequi]
MKKSLFLLAIFALALMTSCKTTPTPEQLNCNPNPLTVVGNTVTAEITGTFPEKKFVRKGVLEVTPVLKYNGKELVGETVTYVGEKAKVNGKVVSYANGGTYKQTFTCQYDEEMAQCELYLRFHATKGDKEYEQPDYKVADGMLATVKNAKADDNKGAVTGDKFQRIIEEMTEADIKFLIQQAALRNSETKSQKVKDLQAAIKDANDAENKEVASLEVIGYASPDGATDLNEGLADRRQAAAEKFLAKALKKAKLDVDIEGSTTAEDWDGFQALMENSNIQDKDLVLRVLSMYSDPEEREAQIKNLSSVYKNIADDILPELRRSRLVLTTYLIGKSDEEIAKLAKENPSELTVEELLYAATLTNDKNEKLALYNKAQELFPNDFRAYNNAGLIYFEKGDVAAAQRCYAKALEIEPANPDVNYNAGVAALAQGDLAKAEQYFGKAAGTSANLDAAMGTYYTMKGDYAAASKAYGNTVSNNAAVQQILNEDYASARKTLDAIAEPNATTDYLKAIVAARTNDREGVYANLKAAVAKDAALKAKAAKDLEFAKFAEDEAFLAIVK